MQITSFNVDNNTLVLNLEDASNITSLKLWTENTFKDFNQAIDLLTLLNGNAVQQITINPSDINMSEINGIFFIEAEDDTDISFAYTYNLNLYKECILDKIIKNIECKECFDYFDKKTINAHSLLISTEYAIDLGYIEIAMDNLKALSNYCNNKCNTCKEYSNLIDNNLFDLN